MADSKLTALTELTTPAPTDIIHIVDDPSGSPVNKKIELESILNSYNITAAETSAGVTPTNYQYEPGNVLRYGAVRDSATNDSAAFQAAIDQAKQTNGEEVYVPPGDYHITSTITIANCRDVSIRGTYGSTLQWNGATSSPCLQFGDGTNTTFGILVNGISIEDETTGTGNLTTNGLVLIDQCHRSRFTNMYIFASSELSAGTGLLISESWILDFYGCRFNNLNNGVAIGSDSAGVLACNFYGTQIENFTTAGFNCDSTAGYATRINFNGGTIENGELSGGTGTGIGIKITATSVEMNITGVYFEKNDNDIFLSHVASANSTVSVRDCWFKDGGAAATGNDAHIYHAGQGTTLYATGNIFVDRAGVDIAHASAKYIGRGNTVQSVVEIHASSTGDSYSWDRVPGDQGYEITTPEFRVEGPITTPATTLADSATPSVAGGNVFITGAANTYTNFTGGLDGQVITIISMHAAVFDVTSTNLRGGTVDITTAAGDVTNWVYHDASNVWRLIGFMDHSVDNSTGA